MYCLFVLLLCSKSSSPQRSRNVKFDDIMICFFRQSSKVNNVTYPFSSEDDCRRISKTGERQRMLKDEIELRYMLSWLENIFSYVSMVQLEFHDASLRWIGKCCKGLHRNTCESNLQQGSKESGWCRWGFTDRKKQENHSVIINYLID